jgi:hypothetical protein
VRRSRSSTTCTRSPTVPPGADPVDTTAGPGPERAARDVVGPHQLRARVPAVLPAVRRRAQPTLEPARARRCALQPHATWRCRPAPDGVPTPHAWWLNPEHMRHWDTGDSAAGPYGELVAHGRVPQPHPARRVSCTTSPGDD